MIALIPPTVFSFAAGLACASLWHDLRTALFIYRVIARQLEA